MLDCNIFPMIILIILIIIALYFLSRNEHLFNYQKNNDSMWDFS